MRFRNPVDLGGFLDFSLDFWISVWISGFLDFKVDFWISKWISGFQSGFLDFKWISGFQSGFLDFKADFWISLFLKIQLMNNHEPHSSEPIQAVHRYIAHRQRVR